MQNWCLKEVQRLTIWWWLYSLLFVIWFFAAESCTHNHGAHHSSLSKNTKLQEISRCAHWPSVSVPIYAIGYGCQHSSYSCIQRRHVMNSELPIRAQEDESMVVCYINGLSSMRGMRTMFCKLGGTGHSVPNSITVDLVRLATGLCYHWVTPKCT